MKERVNELAVLCYAIVDIDVVWGSRFVSDMWHQEAT